MIIGMILVSLDQVAYSSVCVVKPYIYNYHSTQGKVVDPCLLHALGPMDICVNGCIANIANIKAYLWPHLTPYIMTSIQIHAISKALVSPNTLNYDFYSNLCNFNSSWWVYV